jgi:hypothetical protein
MDAGLRGCLGSFLSAIISGDLQVNAWVPSLWASAFGDSEYLGSLLLYSGASFWASAHALPVDAPADMASAAHCNLPFQAGFRPSSFLSGELWLPISFILLLLNTNLHYGNKKASFRNKARLKE